MLGSVVVVFDLGGMSTPRRVVFASVLKPVGDPRMYEKMAATLAATGRYDVHVVGYPQPGFTPVEGVTLHPLPPFKRLSVGRWRARWRLWGTLRRVKPDITIVTTHDYLTVILLNRIIFGGRFMYDVQENYRLNLWSQSVYKSVLKFPFGLLVRWKEWLTRPAVCHYLLAEASYGAELGFTKGRSTLIENKALPLPASTERSTPWDGAGELRLLYSGTIAEVYGIFEAIDWVVALQKLHPSVRLNIVGYAPDAGTLARVKAKIANLYFVQLEGGDQFVPHERIQAAAGRAHFGLLPYPKNPSTWRCRPTKLFEYASGLLPMLCVPNPFWTEPISAWNAGLTVDFQAAPTVELLAQLKANSFYHTGAPSEASWASEGERLVELIDSIS